jgi:hypothetical protein
MGTTIGKNDRELEVFSGFVAASRLPVAPDTIRHSPENVDEPDVLCSVGGCEEYFEITEIFWERPEIPGETLAKGLHESGRAAKRKSGLIADGKPEEAGQIVTVGSFGYPPLLSIKQSLQRKISKPYALSGKPCSLLLYYDRQSPVEPYDLLYECMPVLTEMLTAAPFKIVWLYHHSVKTSISLRQGSSGFARLASGGRVRLSEFSRSEDVNAVIGKIALRNGELFMAFDSVYSETFNAALNQANAANARAARRAEP